MSELKYCQGPKCHEYRTKDRIRGPKGDKHYETRKRSSFYYGKSNFCSVNCTTDWLTKFADMAINRFGRITEPKRIAADSAWYKDSKWNRTTDNYDQYYFINDLLGQCIPITRDQYNDQNLRTPTASTV